MRSWVECMENQRHAEAYRKSLDLHAVGTPLAEKLSLTQESFGLKVWRNKPPAELLDGLVGFLDRLSAAASVDLLDNESFS